jgi:3-methylfumaryl-CoA hydratase
MSNIKELIEASMPELRTWIGHREVIEDEIGLTTVRRIAAMLDLEPRRFVPGTELPPHWFAMFFHDNAMQRDIGPDGHPNKGIFLPPIPLPRRMGAGRRVRISGALRACEPARRVAEVVGITPKVARTGSLVVLTMRHTIEVKDKTIAVDDFDAVYREGIVPGERNPLPKPTNPPANAAWSKTLELSNALVFRYSAITWNAHRIHYDADYARRDEGYPEVVQNGGLTMQLIIDAALPHLAGRLSGFEARLTRPLWVGDRVIVQGSAAHNGRMSCWGVDKDGYQCAALELEYAA